MNKKTKKGLFRFRNCFMLIIMLYTFKHFIFYHIPFYYYNKLSATTNISKEDVNKLLYLFSSKKSATCCDTDHIKECITYSLLGVPSIKIILKEDKIINLYPKFDSVMLP